MEKVKGPAIFLAQFMRDEEPYDSIENIGGGWQTWGTQVSRSRAGIRAIDIDRAAESKTYCDEYRGKLKEMGLSRILRRVGSAKHSGLRGIPSLALSAFSWRSVSLNSPCVETCHVSIQQGQSLLVMSSPVRHRGHWEAHYMIDAISQQDAGGEL